MYPEILAWHEAQIESCHALQPAVQGTYTRMYGASYRYAPHQAKQNCLLTTFSGLNHSV